MVVVEVEGWAADRIMSSGDDTQRHIALDMHVRKIESKSCPAPEAR